MYRVETEDEWCLRRMEEKDDYLAEKLAEENHCNKCGGHLDEHDEEGNCPEAQ
jgi:hypothetical protein